MKANTKHVTLWMDANLERALRIGAALENIDHNEFIQRAVQERLERLGYNVIVWGNGNDIPKDQPERIEEFLEYIGALPWSDRPSDTMARNALKRLLPRALRASQVTVGELRAWLESDSGDFASFVSFVGPIRQFGKKSYQRLKQLVAEQKLSSGVE